MENGIIKYYNKEAGYGYTTTSSGQDAFFHISDVQNELKQLLFNLKYRYEPVVFELRASSKKSGENEAFNLNLDLSKRKVGYVEVEDGRYGTKYFIIDHNDSKKYYFHYSDVLTNDTDKYISIDSQDPAIFTGDKNDKGLIAKDVKILVRKPFLESFANFTDYELALKDLAENICEREDWDYINDKQNGIPILKSYINHTCKRLVQQAKVVSGTSSYGDEYCFFNTGLVDDFQSEVYAFFERNRKYVDNQPWGVKEPKWRFLEFNTDQSRYFKYFTETPEIATYFEEADSSKLMFDTRITIRPNWEHLLSRQKRIASITIQNMNEQDFRDSIEDSIVMAKKRIKRNYKTAIPHYYDGEIQFLIPLTERRNRGVAIAAMAVEKQEQIYVVSTILTLDQAYNNARLLAKPDREWLNP